MRPFFLSLVAGTVAAISFEDVLQVYNNGPVSISVEGNGYISAFKLWQSPSKNVNVFIEDIIPQAPCNSNQVCHLHRENNSLIFDPTSYPDGDNYLFSINWSENQFSRKTDIQTVWSTFFMIGSDGGAEERLELRDTELQATGSGFEVSISSTTSALSTANSSPSGISSAAAIMATGQTFAAIDPITIDVILHENVTENNIDALSTNSTNSTATRVTSEMAIATQSTDGLLRAPIAINTSGVLVMSSTSKMALATLPTTKAASTATAIPTVDENGSVNNMRTEPLIPIGMVVVFGLLHLWS